MEQKSLDYYLSLEYDVIIRRVKDEDRTLYKATARELNADVFYGIGSTVQKAFKDFDRSKADMFTYYVQSGVPIPEPQPQIDDLPSGHFVTRTTPLTHRKLIDLARANRQSLNATVNRILTEYVTSESFLDAVSSRLTVLMREAGIQRATESHTNRPWYSRGSYEASVCQDHGQKVTDIRKYKSKREVAAS